MSRYAKLAATPVPQAEPLNERQVQNNAGGFVFALDDWKRLDRFLILGSDSSTYYQKAPKLTRENTACVTRCYAADARRTVARIVEVSQAGRAPKNDAAIYALALGVADKDETVRASAYSAVGLVCRTATHLFQFIQVVKALGKGISSPGMKKVLKRWYTARPVDAIAYQMVKYREREGFNHARALNVCGYGGKEAPALHNLFLWAKGKQVNIDELPRLVQGHQKAMSLQDDPKAVAKLITEYKLPFEAVPKEVQGKAEVWEAALPDLGITALIRNLGRMTNYGLLKPLGKETKFVVEQLTDEALLKKGRVHPFNVLLAHAIYSAGQAQYGGRRGGDGMTWTPVPAIVDALEEAFYASFKTVEPSGKRTLIGLDVSGSMSSSLMGSPLLVCSGAAAMAMTTMRVEEQWHVFAFDSGFKKLPLTAKMSLEQVLKHTKDINGGGTDCALPMIYAAQHDLEVDTFQVFTDNETWAGRSHPVEALKKYRQKSGINAKLIVVGMTATNFTIADPTDPGMLDVVGFDSAAPAVMAEFARS